VARFDPSDQRHVTALHEAGHAVFAIAMGVEVLGVTIEPDRFSEGRVEHRPLPRPSEAQCAPGSAWINLEVKLSLAGDRAVRLLSAHRTTAGGGRASDYADANRYLDAVYEAHEVEGWLDRLAGELDDFFAKDVVQKDVDKLASALLEVGTLKGNQVYELLTDKRCGAFSPDFEHRCSERRPHHVCGPHIAPPQVGVWQPIFWELLEYEAPPKGRSGSSRWLRVMRVHSPSEFPPPKRSATTADLPALREIMTDPNASPRQQSAAGSKVMRLLADRIREAGRLLPATGATSSDAASRHDDECHGHLYESAPGVLWCCDCALEIAVSGAKTDAVYVVRECESGWFQFDDDIPAILPVGEQTAFRTATDAANFIRLMGEMVDRPQYRAERLLLPPKVRRQAANGGSTAIDEGVAK